MHQLKLLTAHETLNSVVISGTVTALKEYFIFCLLQHLLESKIPQIYLLLFWISVQNTYKYISNEFMITSIHFVMAYWCDWIICSSYYEERTTINRNVD
jgi:hypothetical protein